ncbi:MAG: hypothetical protein QME14_06975 [Methanobacteriaceae archaeon]|nr:hypothetical protein [Methanobacteriaceae archaeon]
METVEITEDDVIETLDIFTKVPSFLLRRWVSSNKNLVKMFQGQIEDQKDKISQRDMLRLNKVLEMPVDELQEVLNRAYHQTNKKQLKILSEPQAKSFITLNMNELKRIFTNNSK